MWTSYLREPPWGQSAWPQIGCHSFPATMECERHGPPPRFTNCPAGYGDIPQPGYHPEGMYELKTDLDGDMIEDITYRLTFDV
jgi:hypothetical protein